jgi:predicted dehydrogenase
MHQVIWGMIGCGNVTEIKSGPAFYKTENSSLIAVMCRHIDSARNYATRHNIPYYYDDADQIISNPLINAVYIATPVKFHAPYAIHAMEAGKAVYLEKPMALNYKQCLDLKEVSDKTGSKLFVAYYRRSLDYFLKIKELIAENQIGDIIDVSLTLHNPTRQEDYNSKKLPWRVMPEISGGGYFYDLACHQIDIMQFLLGQITIAEGYAENIAGLYPAEDTVHAKWILKSGVKGIGSWSFICNEKDKQDKIILTGTKGRIEFSTFNFTPIVLEVDHTIRTFDMKPPIHIQMPFIKTIINELTGRGVSDANLESAINTNRIMEEIIYKK